MHLFADEWFPGFSDRGHLERVVMRLVIATILGGLVGFERQVEHKAAGMRTHMLVALGAALFTLIPLEAKMSSADISRVLQGIAAGIGFLGAGTILKLSDQHEIKGLTTAATVWLTAAAGAAVGAGWIWPAVVAVVLVWFILYFLGRLEHWLTVTHRRNDQNRGEGGAPVSRS
jgi:putative Mg2+ transporter-C (MgtC) family protein